MTDAPRNGWDLGDEVLAAYDHILFTPDWDKQTLGAATGVGPSEAGRLLDALIAARLIRASQERSGELTPVAPSVGLREALEEGENDLLERTAAIQRLRARAADLDHRFRLEREARSESTFEELRGLDTTVRRIGELINAATTSISTVVSTLPGPEALDQARDRDRELTGRGIRIRALYLEGHRRQSRPLRDYLDWLGSLGAQVRITQALPPRLICVDDHTAVVATNPARATSGAIVIRTPGLVATLSQFFDLLWDGARPIAATGRARTDVEGVEFEDLELAVVRLLAQGHKDEAVARRIGMSLRSVRRVIGTVSDKLETSSRFELGVRCRDLGLVPADHPPPP